MKRRDLILTIIKLCHERPEFGRTSLQKIAYLCGLSLGIPLGHSAYFYGPYSSTVEQDVASLLLSGLIEEKSRILGVSRAGFEVAKYEYRLTREGEDRIDAVASEYPGEFDKVKDIVREIERLAGSMNQQILAPFAKVVFIQLSQESNLSPSEVHELASNFGWRLGKDQVERVQALLNEFGDPRERFATT